MARLSDASIAKINEICDRYVGEKTPLMMILSAIQEEYGYIPLEVQEIVSERTGISVAEIYGVVTFYSFLGLQARREARHRCERKGLVEYRLSRAFALRPWRSRLCSGSGCAQNQRFP